MSDLRGGRRVELALVGEARAGAGAEGPLALLLLLERVELVRAGRDPAVERLHRRHREHQTVVPLHPGVCSNPTLTAGCSDRVQPFIHRYLLMKTQYWSFLTL